MADPGVRPRSSEQRAERGRLLRPPPRVADRDGDGLGQRPAQRPSDAAVHAAAGARRGHRRPQQNRRRLRPWPRHLRLAVLSPRADAAHAGHTRHPRRDGLRRPVERRRSCPATDRAGPAGMRCDHCDARVRALDHTRRPHELVLAHASQADRPGHLADAHALSRRGVDADDGAGLRPLPRPARLRLPAAAAATRRSAGAAAADADAAGADPPREHFRRIRTLQRGHHRPRPRTPRLVRGSRHRSGGGHVAVPRR